MVAKKTAAKQSPAAAGDPGATGSPGDPEAPDGAPAKASVRKRAAGKAATKAAPSRAPAAETAAEAEAEAPAGKDPKAAKTSKSPAKKATAAEKTAKKATAEKPAARKAAKKAAVGETAAGGAAAPGANHSAAESVEKTVKKASGRKAAGTKKQTGARTVAAKKTAGGVTTAEDEAAVPPARTGELAVRPGEDPWTPDEVAEARSELQAEVLRLRSELAHSQEELTGLMRDSGDGAGQDEADTGTKNITREHELALAANAREMLEQTEHALERLDAGTYGLCEVCGKPIGKARMQAFPRATLCVEDKQKQERRG
ncbi:DNA-binding protein [Streptomyces sp. R302]|uniref:TraR/DksA family transcriptional regulator n=1 Tax=unclassified Streptomyces TaxID=2593676 RepID=UPI00145EC950|nr:MULTISPECIES: TraR/DksA C4-type zinc finger protein [unclassified Streptomyces]NML49630.1 DNA-binding protein [Streptomyces sp. R301]NML77957.1 DNA-binding protein [Streptomyces sp. R302]